MNALLLSHHVLSGGPNTGPRVTREAVRARARELALLAGRPPALVTQHDYEQAKREITGESDFDRQEATLELSSADAQETHPSH